MAIEKTKKPQTFIVDVDLGPQIQMILAQKRMGGKEMKFNNISEFVNQAINEKLRREQR